MIEYSITTRKFEHDSVQCYYQKIRTLQCTVQQTRKLEHDSTVLQREH